MIANVNDVLVVVVCFFDVKKTCIHLFSQKSVEIRRMVHFK